MITIRVESSIISINSNITDISIDIAVLHQQEDH